MSASNPQAGGGWLPASNPVQPTGPGRMGTVRAALRGSGRQRAYPVVKRCLDCAFAAVFLAVFCWVFPICALALKIENRTAPVMYNAIRTGRGGALFRMYKFRTMLPSKSGTGAVASAANVTRVGGVLRKLSLDELPQMLNILKGDMSLIGPRPLLEEYLPWYTAEENRRHRALPGITGYAQAKGRASLAWRDKFALDVYYVEHMSLSLDLWIVGASIKKVLSREDVFTPPDAIANNRLDLIRQRELAAGATRGVDLVGPLPKPPVRH